jgi:hypothetical protein
MLTVDVLPGVRVTAADGIITIAQNRQEKSKQGYFPLPGVFGQNYPH